MDVRTPDMMLKVGYSSPVKFSDNSMKALSLLASALHCMRKNADAVRAVILARPTLPHLCRLTLRAIDLTIEVVLLCLVCDRTQE